MLVRAAGRLLRAWKGKGWLDGTAPRAELSPTESFRPAPAAAPTLSAVYRPLKEAVRLVCGVPVLQQDLEAVLAPAATRARGSEVPTVQVVAGEDGRFAVTTDGAAQQISSSLGGARWDLLRALVVAGCACPAPPLIIHGAAVAASCGAITLVGGSRAGKTTLTAALIAAGMPFISDDIVLLDLASCTTSPVRLAMGCKADGWSVVSRILLEFDTNAGPPLHGGKVRYFWPPAQRRVEPGASLPVRLAILPSFVAGCAPDVARLRPDQFLSALGTSGAVFPAAPEQLGRLLAWVEATPAYTLAYGDTDWAVAAVRELVSGMAP